MTMRGWTNCLALPLLLAPLLLQGCNVFAPLDSPRNDAQILSAARACFDRGDLTCAKDYYARLAGTELAEIAAAEKAFALLDENGVGMSVFMTAMSKGNANQGLTVLAGKLSFYAGEASRTAIYSAYRNIESISGNTELRGLVRFASAFALAAEILAEESGADGSLAKTDLANSPTACTAAISSCPASDPAGSACLRTGTQIAAGSGVDIRTSPSATALDGTSPTWGQFYGAIQAVELALSTELGSKGTFQSGTGAVATALTLLDPLNAPECFRATLLSQGVGQ